VPRFGSQLYRLSTAPGPASEKSQHLQAIRRKFHQPIHLVRVSPLYQTWCEHLEKFLSDIYASPIHAIVFDYDGTLVDVADRFDPPKQEIREQLLRLLNAGVKIGIATGRGKSVRRDLRQVIPREMWADVTIGYHNGAEIGPLESDLLPGADIDLDPAIARCKTEIEKTAKIAQLIELSWSRFQLSAQWRKPQLGWKLLDVLKPIVQAAGGHDLQIVSSGHSVDILSKTISKRNVVLRLAKQYGIDLSSILGLGDQGWYPGNDHELLSHTPSLSVDQVSGDPSTCWRLSPPLVKGPAATLWYLGKLVSNKKGAGVRFSKGSLMK
jgi:HAD superfamily hydrolase (TIGR01484 family)